MFGTREIRDQAFDEKQNIVTITVVCCSPEKIRDKLCRRGGKTIKSIEIKEPPKPKAPEKPKEPEKPKAPEKPKEPEKPKAPEKPKEPEKPKAPEKPKEPEKPKVPEKPKEPEKPKPPAHPPVPEPVIVQYGYPTPAYPGMPCCGPCSEGYGGGPCYHGYGRPAPPPPRPVYDGYGYEYGYGYGYGGSRPCNVNRCGNYFSEENPSGCTIM